MSEKVKIANLYREFDEALNDFVAASLSADNDLGVVLPRRARLAKARERLCSHPDVRTGKIRPHSPQSVGYEAAMGMNETISVLSIELRG